METIKRYLRVDRGAIGLIRFVFEGYEGIAGVTTLDPGAGVIALFVAPGCEPDVEEILQDIQRWIHMENVDNPFLDGGIQGALRSGDNVF